MTKQLYIFGKPHKKKNIYTKFWYAVSDELLPIKAGNELSNGSGTIICAITADISSVDKIENVRVTI